MDSYGQDSRQQCPTDVLAERRRATGASSAGDVLPRVSLHDELALYYVPAFRAVVAIEAQRGGGWDCQVVTRRIDLARAALCDYVVDVPETVHVRRRLLADAHGTMQVDPVEDPQGFAMLWRARLWQPPPNPISYIAGSLERRARLSHGITVDIRRDDLPLLYGPMPQATGRRVIQGLIARGLLTRTHQSRNKVCGTVRLTLLPTTTPKPTASMALSRRAGAPAGTYWPHKER